MDCGEFKLGSKELAERASYPVEVEGGGEEEGVEEVGMVTEMEMAVVGVVEVAEAVEGLFSPLTWVRWGVRGVAGVARWVRG
jgi:hypothetical protein